LSCMYYLTSSNTYQHVNHKVYLHYPILAEKPFQQVFLNLVQIPVPFQEVTKQMRLLLLLKDLKDDHCDRMIGFCQRKEQHLFFAYLTNIETNLLELPLWHLQTFHQKNIRTLLLSLKSNLKQLFVLLHSLLNGHLFYHKFPLLNLQNLPSYNSHPEIPLQLPQEFQDCK